MQVSHEPKFFAIYWAIFDEYTCCRCSFLLLVIVETCSKNCGSFVAHVSPVLESNNGRINNRPGTDLAKRKSRDLRRLPESFAKTSGRASVVSYYSIP